MFLSLSYFFIIIIIVKWIIVVCWSVYRGAGVIDINRVKNHAQCHIAKIDLNINVDRNILIGSLYINSLIECWAP